MIFVTVGHQMPFDRMIRAVDAWAGARDGAQVFAQIGQTDYVPTNIEWAATIHPEEFRQRVRDAEAVVAHAGMGTILTALELKTPIVVMPRRGALRETRNDHQLATAERLRELGRLHVAMDEIELSSMLDQIASLPAPRALSPAASPQLLRAVADFIGPVE